MFQATTAIICRFYSSLGNSSNVTSAVYAWVTALLGIRVALGRPQRFIFKEEYQSFFHPEEYFQRQVHDLPDNWLLFVHYPATVVCLFRATKFSSLIFPEFSFVTTDLLVKMAKLAFLFHRVQPLLELRLCHGCPFEMLHRLSWHRTDSGRCGERYLPPPALLQRYH